MVEQISSENAITLPTTAHDSSNNGAPCPLTQLPPAYTLSLNAAAGEETSLLSLRNIVGLDTELGARYDIQKKHSPMALTHHCGNLSSCRDCRDTIHHTTSNKRCTRIGWEIRNKTVADRNSYRYNHEWGILHHQWLHQQCQSSSDYKYIICSLHAFLTV